MKSECHSRKQTAPPSVCTYYIQQPEQSNSPELEAAIFGISQETQELSGHKPITVPVEIEGVSLELELDTGAAVSIVSYADYCKYFCHIPLSTTTKHLHVYSGLPKWQVR